MFISYLLCWVIKKISVRSHTNASQNKATSSQKSKGHKKKSEVVFFFKSQRKLHLEALEAKNVKHLLGTFQNFLAHIKK